MLQIPRAPLLLGLAGLIPFVAGACIATGAMNGLLTAAPDEGFLFVPQSDGVSLLVLYGTIILSFMSGVLWGFATKTQGPRAILGYVLSVLPAIWALLTAGQSPADRLVYLGAGFAALLLLDFYFYRLELAPPWWMRLRFLLTGIVLVCLTIGRWV
nr:DUF3429 domain-containing protein [Sulfitobacter guttiformis]